MSYSNFCRQVDAARAKLGADFAYLVWDGTFRPIRTSGHPPIGWRFDVGRHVTAKSAAIAAHRSQTTDLIDDDPDGFRLAPEVTARFTGRYEILLDGEPEQPT